MLGNLEQEEIRAVCEFNGHPEFAQAYIDLDVPVGVVRKDLALGGKLIRAALGEKRQSRTSHRVELLADERDKFRAAAADAIAMRGGVRVDNPAPGARDLMSRSLRELALEAVWLINPSARGGFDALFERAMTTSDFPLILQDSARKALFEGYDSEAQTWRVWCGIGQAKDFKEHKIIQASVGDDLDEVGEHQPYNYGEADESQETFLLATYGKIFAITRYAVINDDLSALTNIPKAYGEAAARKIGDLVYEVLTSNPTMGDGIALFHSSHGNIGTGGAVSETTIAEAIKLMRLQKDVGEKKRLNIRPQFFIAPAALEGSSEIFFTSNQFAGSDTGATRNNPYAGTRFTRVYDARLDDDSITAWYMAGPKGRTVTVFFLAGMEKPELQQQPGWTVDGIECKVRLDAAVKAVDWRALVKNAGA